MNHRFRMTSGRLMTKTTIGNKWRIASRSLYWNIPPIQLSGTKKTTKQREKTSCGQTALKTENPAPARDAQAGTKPSAKVALTTTTDLVVTTARHGTWTNTYKGDLTKT